MLQREQMLLEQRRRIIKQSEKKFWFKFERSINDELLSFKVWIDCSSWNGEPVNMESMSERIDKLIVENENYHLLVDKIYEQLASSYPEKNIWIELNNQHFGLLAKYETHSPSTLLKI
jgi:hypothetical protein